MNHRVRTCLFHICTLVTNSRQYASMKASFVAAGFDETVCRYSVFDNSGGNTYEPYSLISKLSAETREPYIILCHQDVLCDKGHDYGHLVKVINELEKADASWAVIGNAGCTDEFEFIVRVSDPTDWEASDRVAADWPHLEPQPVHSLDENFLVLKTAVRLRSSPSLSGFHLYGTDLCLNARRSGHTCYVADFRLTHLSPGNFGPDFFAARARFVARWSPEFHFLYVIRGAEIFLSRWTLLRRLGPRHRVRSLLMKHRPLRKWMTRELQQRVVNKSPH